MPSEQTLKVEIMDKLVLALIFLLEYKHRALPPYCISSPKTGNEKQTDTLRPLPTVPFFVCAKKKIKKDRSKRSPALTFFAESYFRDVIKLVRLLIICVVDNL